MIKNAFVYRVRGATELGSAALIEALSTNNFAPCAPTQEKSVGWVAPRETNGALVESIDSQWIAELAIETKSVPKSEIDKFVAAAVDRIEQETGRKPGKKERRELKEEALVSLLPNAFAKRKDIPVWIDPTAGMLVVGAGSQSVADDVITAIVRATDKLSMSLIQTMRSPQGAMIDWLLSDHIDVPGAFSIERDCVLKSDGEDAATVKFSQHNLDNPEVRQHITEGKHPTQLAMSWDGRMSMVLTEGMQIKKIQLLDGVTDASGTDKNEDRFDADVALMTGTLGPMIDELIFAMGGEVQISEGGAA